MSQTKCVYKTIINTHRYIQIPKDAASAWTFWQRATEALDVLASSTKISFSERSYLSALQKATQIALDTGVVPENIRWSMPGRLGDAPPPRDTAVIIGLRVAPATPLRNKYALLLQRIEPLLNLPEYVIPAFLRPDEYEEDMPFLPLNGLPEAQKLARMFHNSLTTIFRNGTPLSPARRRGVKTRINDIFYYDAKYRVRRWSEMNEEIRRFKLLVFLEKICFQMADPVSLNDFSELSVPELRRVIALLENPPTDLPTVPFNVHALVTRAHHANVKGHCFQQQSLKAIPAPRRHPLTRRQLNAVENAYIDRD